MLTNFQEPVMALLVRLGLKGPFAKAIAGLIAGALTTAVAYLTANGWDFAQVDWSDLLLLILGGAGAGGGLPYAAVDTRVSRSGLPR